MAKYRVDSQELTDEIISHSDGSFIDLPCGKTHYSVEGEGKEWVVLVHGYATPLFIYDKIAEGLVKEGYKILRYDLLGRGLSERVNNVYNPELFAEQLKELTDKVIGDDAFYLIGTSMGGTITTTFTAANPDKVKKLVLLAPAGMVFEAPAYMVLANVKVFGEMMFYTIGGKVLVKNCAKEMIYSGDEAKEEYREKFAYYAQFKGTLKATLSSLRNTILNFETARKGYDGVAEAKTPVLVIWGTKDQTMPYYQAERIQKVLPQMELITYEGSGHIFLYDEGKRTVKDILPFLRG